MSDRDYDSIRDKQLDRANACNLLWASALEAERRRRARWEREREEQDQRWQRRTR